MDHMAGIAGLEPTHTRVKVWCLTDLAISQNTVCRLCLKGFVGAPGRNRTPDTRIRSPLLYPAELQAHIFLWSGWRESNPRNQLGRLGLYHWATPAYPAQFENWICASFALRATIPWRVLQEPHRLVFGGDERIRTTESKANGFTVRPIWPTLEHPHIFKLYLIKDIISSPCQIGFCTSCNHSMGLMMRRQYLSSLAAQAYLELMIGLEPTTYWLQINCSANWATSAHWITIAIQMATWMRFELTTSAVTGRHSNQLNYQAINIMLIINYFTFHGGSFTSRTG